MNHCKDLNQYIHEAIYYNDNYDLRMDDTSFKASGLSIKVSLQAEEIIKGVKDKIQ